MKLYLKLMMVFPVLFLTSFSYVLLSDVFSQTLNDQDTTPNSWISERDNLNVTMSLTPKVPTVDQPTELQFEIRELISGIPYNNLTANVTIVDSDGRLFKFAQQPVSDGIFSVIYIFPDDALNTIIVQIKRNSTAFGAAAFEVDVPHTSPGDFWSQLFQPRPF
ncbi:hypothetical protein [Candidatus Nitrosocosmicus sp. T]